MYFPINLHLHRALLVKKNIHVLATGGYLTVFFTVMLADRFLMNILAELCKKLQFFSL